MLNQNLLGISYIKIIGIRKDTSDSVLTSFALLLLLLIIKSSATHIKIYQQIFMRL